VAEQKGFARDEHRLDLPQVPGHFAARRLTRRAHTRRIGRRAAAHRGTIGVKLGRQSVRVRARHGQCTRPEQSGLGPVLDDAMQARARARETSDTAKAAAETELAHVTGRVDAEMALKLERAETRISKLREDAMNNVEQISLDAAEAMIARLGVKASRADVNKAVSSVLDTRR
jgi:hypothetical protein